MIEKPDLNGFDEFWAAYPKRKDKIAAMRMYARALKMTTSAEILRAAKLYAGEVAGKEERFTKYPATWLNAGGWANYSQPVITSAPVGFYAKFTSPEREAWDRYGRETRGRDYPKDKQGGWYFPSRWPPSPAPGLDRRDAGDDVGIAGAGH
jgi:hypothetical protein